ncbi:hypothetical protein H7170_02775 [Candidatus Gracilibacteria bacterium]|nr:hypothetical protein [Candidatus Gracilibacteria bacterium]
MAITVEGRYIYSILRGITIPNFSGWFIISLSMWVIFFASFFSGGGFSIYLIGVLAILHSIEAILSLRYGVFQMTRFEKILIGSSIVGIILWVFTASPLYALLINILIDSIGMTAIAYKLFRFPETEDTYAWGVSVLMYCIDIFAIEKWSISDSLFIVINVCTCGIVFLLTFRKMHLLKKAQLYFAQFLHIKI